MNKPFIVMQSDFGSGSGLASCMHGVCKAVDSSLEIYDISHDIPAYDIFRASANLNFILPCWPAGTIFVSVVDPGVGTSRRASVAKLKNGSYIVTPDNGALTYADEFFGIESIREIDEVTNRRNETREVSTFHGRDLFAYCAAKLAAGIITFEEVGPEYPVSEVQKHPIHKATVEPNFVIAQVTSFDPFGSAELSVSNSAFTDAGFTHEDMVDITITAGEDIVFHKEVLYHKSFGYVPLGEEILFNDLATFVTIAINQGSFYDKYNLDEDTTYSVTLRKK